jgi:hypothetical protein
VGGVKPEVGRIAAMAFEKLCAIADQPMQADHDSLLGKRGGAVRDVVGIEEGVVSGC